MADFFNAHLSIMHINEEENLNTFQKSNMNVLDDYLGSVSHSFHWMPYETDKSDVIRLFLRELKSDMLAMINYDHRLFEELVREPVVKRLAFNSEVPLLVIPELGVRSSSPPQNSVGNSVLG